MEPTLSYPSFFLCIIIKKLSYKAAKKFDRRIKERILSWVFGSKKLKGGVSNVLLIT